MSGSRRAFTLLELLVAITVTGVVALLAYGSAQAGFDTDDRLTRHRTTVEAEAQFRSLVSDALRHPVDATAVDEMLLTLVDATDQTGMPTDRLRFLSRGIVPPLGTSAPWEVTIAADPDGLRFVARPMSGSDAGAIRAVLTRVRGLDIRVLARRDDPGWLAEWTSGGRMPAAVELSFIPANGLPRGAPLVVRVGLEVAP